MNKSTTHLPKESLGDSYNSVSGFDWPFFFFCNSRNLFLSFGGPQQYNSETLPFTYDQYVVMELADKVYNSLLLFVFMWVHEFSFR